MSVRLGVNIDHVATLRNARDGFVPDVLRAAREVAAAGAHGVTVHLREDRRHIRDKDVERLVKEGPLPVNLEMAPTQEMVFVARTLMPQACCLVPERREELTTEGGLDVCATQESLRGVVEQLGEMGIRVSLFIDPEDSQVEASCATGADAVELHTGAYCRGEEDRELERLCWRCQKSFFCGFRSSCGTWAYVHECEGCGGNKTDYRVKHWSFFGERGDFFGTARCGGAYA